MAKSFKARIYKMGKKYRLDYFNEDGVRRRIRFRTWTEANNERIRIEGELKNNTHVDPKKRTDVEPLEAGEIRVEGTLSTAKVKGEENQNRFRWFDPKTSAGRREIPIPKDLVEHLRDWKRRCPPNTHNLVFPSPLGEPLHRSNILKRGLYPAVGQAQVKEITMHGFRYSYASMLINLRGPITDITRYLGHKDVHVTYKVYAHFLKPKTTT